jgi:hypothetical protein
MVIKTEQSTYKNGSVVNLENLDAWMKEVSDRVTVLEESNKALAKLIDCKDELIERLETKIKELAGQVSSVGTSQRQASSSYSAIAAKPGSVSSANVVRILKTNEKLAASRASKVVIAGIEPSTCNDLREASTHDTNAARSVIAATGVQAVVKSVTRMKVSRRGQQNNAPVSPPPLIVELESPDQRDTVLRASKALAGRDEFRNVFIRPDRTPDEQAIFKDLLKERAQANKELGERLGRPYRFVIRGDRVQCIDVSQRVDGHFKIVDWKEASAARKHHQTSNTAI